MRLAAAFALRTRYAPCAASRCGPAMRLAPLSRCGPAMRLAAAFALRARYAPCALSRCQPHSPYGPNHFALLSHLQAALAFASPCATRGLARRIRKTGSPRTCPPFSFSARTVKFPLLHFVISVSSCLTDLLPKSRSLRACDVLLLLGLIAEIPLAQARSVPPPSQPFCRNSVRASLFGSSSFSAFLPKSRSLRACDGLLLLGLFTEIPLAKARSAPPPSQPFCRNPVCSETEILVVPYTIGANRQEKRRACLDCNDSLSPSSCLLAGNGYEQKTRESVR